MSDVPQGAVRSKSAEKKPSHLQWDEDNLKENELIQATIEKGKITEPKTPYHAPLDDATLEIPHLDLDINTTINAAGGEVGGFNKSRQDHYKVKDLKSLLAKKADDEDEGDEASREG